MSDNVTTQSATPATPPANTVIATVEASFSSDTAHVGIAALADISGAEGARTATVISPATSGKQDTGNTTLASIDSKLTNPLPISGTVTTGGLTDTQLRASAVPVSAASLPLPSGAATESTLSGRLSESDFDTKVGSLTETAPSTDTASSGLNGRLQRLAQRLSSLIALLPTALGSGGGLKVDGSGTALPVSAASLPLPSGAATETTLGARLSESDFDTKIGSLTETAPATDTASSGLNGRMQRIAQRLTTINTTLGSPFQAGGSIGNTTFASTVADGANVTLGAKTDAKNTATDGTSVSAMSVWKQISASVQSLVTALGSPFQAGGALGAGAAVIGKVGIDQTTVGTTDSVTVKSKTVYQRVVYGSAQTVFNSSTDIAAGNFSAAGTDFTNNDATIGAVLYADAMIEMPDWGAAPAAGTTVSLYGLPINVDGTDDDTDAPSGTAQGGARWLCSWVIAAADALQRRTMPISLAGIQNGFTPYIKNETTQNMNNDGGTNMVVKIAPWTTVQVG